MIASPHVVWTCIPAAGDSRRGLLRAGASLTPYVVETIVDDARRAGRGARLRLEVTAGADMLDALLVQLARLERRGLRLDVRRRRRPASAA